MTYNLYLSETARNAKPDSSITISQDLVAYVSEDERFFVKDLKSPEKRSKYLGAKYLNSHQRLLATADKILAYTFGTASSYEKDGTFLHNHISFGTGDHSVDDLVLSDGSVYGVDRNPGEGTVMRYSADLSSIEKKVELYTLTDDLRRTILGAAPTSGGIMLLVKNSLKKDVSPALRIYETGTDQLLPVMEVSADASSLLAGCEDRIYISRGDRIDVYYRDSLKETGNEPELSIAFGEGKVISMASAIDQGKHILAALIESEDTIKLSVWKAE